MTITKSKRSENRHVLPFARPAENRVKDFTKNMELAAVLYLAESNRKKGEYPRLKKTEEKLVFITETYYPIYLIPYNKATLLFDGFSLISHTFFCDISPNIEIFNKDIQRNKKTTDSYIASLTRNIDYFKNFKGKEEIRIEGLVTIADLKEDLRNYLPLIKKAKKSFKNIVFLKPTMNTHEIHSGIKQLSELKMKIEKDIQKIDSSMKLLGTATARRIKAIKEEIKRIREKHKKQIKKTQLKLTKRLQQIQNQHNRKITKKSKKYKIKCLKLKKKQIKLKKIMKSLQKEAKTCETKIRSSKRRQSKLYEHHWTKKLERTKKKHQSLKKEIKLIHNRILELEKTQKSELIKHRIACCKRIELTNKTYRERQGSQEAEIIMKRQEIVTLDEITRHITKSMQKILQKKKLFIVEFEKIAIPQRKNVPLLVHIPFYLVRYEKEDKRRYVIYPPSMVKDIGILTKMKGALGTAKVKTLIQPRSQAIAIFLKQLLDLFDKKPILEKDVTEACIQKSILLRKNLRVSVVKGLKQLEKEKWISTKEREVFSKILYTYAPSINGQIETIFISNNNYQTCLPS